MRSKWLVWLRMYPLPEGIHYYEFNGSIVFKIGDSYHVALLSSSGILAGFGINDDDTKESVEKKVANAVLQLQVNERYPKKYDQFLIDGKIHIVAPE